MGEQLDPDGVVSVLTATLAVTLLASVGAVHLFGGARRRDLYRRLAVRFLAMIGFTLCGRAFAISVGLSEGGSVEHAALLGGGAGIFLLIVLFPDLSRSVAKQVAR